MAEKQEPDHESANQGDSSSQESLHGPHTTPSASGAESWWNLPLTNRNIAAYQAGRLLNQFRWNADQAWFGNADLRDIADEIFNQFTAASYSFVTGDENIIEARVRDAREEWREHCTCEEAREDFNAHLDAEPDPAFFDPRWSLEEHYWWLIKVWVVPVANSLKDAFWKHLSSGERWLFKLGGCVDEIVRPHDVHKFIYATTLAFAPEVVDDDNGTARGRRMALRVPNYIPKPGELEPDKDWHVRLSMTWEKTELHGKLSSLLSDIPPRPTREQLLSLAAEIDTFVRKRLVTAKKAWWHGEDETPPTDFFGPLRAPKAQLARALVGGKGDPRSFENACRSGRFWVKSLGRTFFEAWCRNEGLYKKGLEKLRLPGIEADIDPTQADTGYTLPDQ